MEGRVVELMLQQEVSRLALLLLLLSCHCSQGVVEHELMLVLGQYATSCSVRHGAGCCQDTTTARCSVHEKVDTTV